MAFLATINVHHSVTPDMRAAVSFIPLKKGKFMFIVVNTFVSCGAEDDEIKVSQQVMTFDNRLEYHGTMLGLGYEGMFIPHAANFGWKLVEGEWEKIAVEGEEEIPF